MPDQPDQPDDPRLRRFKDAFRNASPELQSLIGPLVTMTAQMHRHDQLLKLDESMLGTDAVHSRGQADLLREASTIRLQLAATLDDLAAYLDRKGSGPAG